MRIQHLTAFFSLFIIGCMGVLQASTFNISQNKGQTIYKIFIEEDGIYRVPHSLLMQHGIDVTGIDPRTITLINKGEQVPIYIAGENDYIFNEGDFILFYGKFQRGEKSFFSPYTKANIYFLQWGGSFGLRMVEDDVSVFFFKIPTTAKSGSYKTSIHLEYQNTFDRSPELNGYDYYYWQKIGLFDISNLFLPIPFPENSADKDFTIRIGLQGTTTDNNSNTKDHNFSFKILQGFNGVDLGQIEWDGTHYATFTSKSLSNSWLVADSLVRFQIQKVNPVDQAYIDWVEVDYWREYKAIDNSITFTNDFKKPFGTQRYHIDNFTRNDIELYDLSGRRLKGMVMTDMGKQNDTTFYRLSFEDEIFDTTYYYAAPMGFYKTPQKIVVDSITEDFNNLQGVEYVLITHKSLMPAAEKLRKFREKGGLTAQIYSVDDIYEKFNHGVESPIAIKNFLQFAYDNWKIQPRYLLLFGDASYNFNSANNLVPTYLVRTPAWGMTASDNWYAELSGGDVLPDLFVGRLPAQLLQDAMVMTDKIIHYEANNSYGPWRREVLLLAGGDETKNWGDPNFFADKVSEELHASFVTEEYEVNKVYTVKINNLEQHFGGKKETMDFLNKGVSIANFNGHGGGSIWADKDMMNLSDVAKLTNKNRLPLFLSLTCFTGFFDNPGQNSLGEEVIKAENGGAIGFIGASGFGWQFGNQFFNTQLFRSIFQENKREFGEILNDAKVKMHANYSAWDSRIVVQYNLLGDPASKLSFPEERIATRLENPAIVSGDTLKITGTFTENVSGTLLVEAFAADNIPFDERKFQFNGTQVNLSILVPNNAKNGKGYVRFYFWNNQKDAMGVSYFQVSNPYLADLRTSPVRPKHNDSVYIFAHASAGSVGTDSLLCVWKTTTDTMWDTISMLSIQTLTPEYKTVSPIIKIEGSEIEYYAVMYYANYKKSITSGKYKFTVRYRPDLLPYNNEITILGTDSLVFVETQIVNQGEVTAKNVIVRYFIDSVTTSQRIGKDVVIDSITAGDKVKASIALPDTIKGNLTFYVYVNQDRLVEETNYANNIAQKNHQVNLFTVTLTKGSDGILTSVDSNITLQIPSQAVSATKIINIVSEKNDTLHPQNNQQSDFYYGAYKLPSDEMYYLEFIDGTQKLLRNATLSMFYDKNDSSIITALNENKLKICIWLKDYKSWTALPTKYDTINNAAISFIQHAGRYSLMKVLDIKQPRFISFMVEGQDFSEGDYVPERPTISAIIRDENKLFPDSIQLYENGVLVLKDEYVSALFSPQSIQTQIIYKPVLSPGNYNFKIVAFDNALNSSSQEISFVSAKDFEISFVANHPNPFWDKTVVAYKLTRMADEVLIKIYTSGGRLVKTFRNFGSIDYDEVIWNGRDELDNLLANGVYYLKIIAKRGKERLERKSIMAFLR